MSDEVSIYQDITNTVTASKDSIAKDSTWYADELAPIIGGVNGRIQPAAGWGCAEGITVQVQGTVSNVMPFIGTDLTDEVRDTDLYLRESSFLNRLSNGTVEMVQKIRSYDPDVLSDEDVMAWTGRTAGERIRYATLHSSRYGSSLYSIMLNFLGRGLIVRSDINYLKMIVLEAMHLYLELYRIGKERVFTSSLTTLDMSHILQNIEGVIQYFTYRRNTRLGMNRFDIIHELRRIEKAVLQAKTDVIGYL